MSDDCGESFFQRRGLLRLRRLPADALSNPGDPERPAQRLPSSVQPGRQPEGQAGLGRVKRPGKTGHPGGGPFGVEPDPGMDKLLVDLLAAGTNATQYLAFLACFAASLLLQRFVPAT